MFTFLSKKLFTKCTRKSRHFIFCLLNILIFLMKEDLQLELVVGNTKYSVTKYSSVTKTGLFIFSKMPTVREENLNPLLKYIGYTVSLNGFLKKINSSEV